MANILKYRLFVDENGYIYRSNTRAYSSLFVQPEMIEVDAPSLEEAINIIKTNNMTGDILFDGIIFRNK